MWVSFFPSLSSKGFSFYLRFPPGNIDQIEFLGLKSDRQHLLFSGEIAFFCRVSHALQFDKGPVLLTHATTLSEELTKFLTFFKENSWLNVPLCAPDPNAPWNSAFYFSEDTELVAECNRHTKGELGKRLCTAAELNLYGRMLRQVAEGRGRTSGGYLKPNQNCNLSSWMSGCEAGWACAVANDYEVDLRNWEDIPYRVFNHRPCCEGFFCPYGLSCMIRKY